MFFVPVVFSGGAPSKGGNLRTSGTAIGNATGGGGLAAAFDNVTNQSGSGCAYLAGDPTSIYCGRSYSTRIYEVICFGANNDGYVKSDNPNVTLTLYGKVGSAPTSGTDGTQLGQISFTDTGNESTGRTITCSDKSTVWDHFWVYSLREGAGNGDMYFAELQFFAAIPWGQPVPITLTYLTSAVSTTDTNSYTHSSLSFGEEATNRKIYVGIISRSASNPSITSVTIGGITATQCAYFEANVDTGYSVCAIYVADVPTGTTGNVVVNWGVTMQRQAVGLWHVVGSVTDADTPTDTVTGSGASVLGGPIDVNAGGFVIAIDISTDDSAVWTELTEDFDDTYGEGSMLYTGASLYSATTQTVTSEVTCSGSSGAAGCHLAAAFR